MVRLSSVRWVSTGQGRNHYQFARGSLSLQSAPAEPFSLSQHRQWITSAATYNTDPVEKELFKSTDTITDATGTATAGVGDAAEVASQLAIQDFASLGLGGYWPSGWIQTAIELLHNHTHLPWWGCIVLLTALLRTACFPLAVKMQVIGAKVANANKDAQAIQQRIMQCRASGDKIGESQAGIDMMKLYQRTANPLMMFPLAFAQLPIFLSMFRGLQGMALLPVESLRTGGSLWFPDLVSPDQYYMLSLLACASFLANIQVMLLVGASG